MSKPVRALKADVEDILTDLKSATRKKLAAAFEQYLGTQPPAWSSRNYMLGNIAWAVQVIDRGLDTNALRLKLLKQCRQAAVKDKPIIKPGTRLVREWHGDTYEVVVLENGYLWRTKQYRSLSVIAREITQSHVSGPRFFGLNKGAQPTYE